MMSERPGGGVHRSFSGGLVETLEVILDKGWVIDVFARVSLVGFEVLSAVHVRTREDAPVHEREPEDS